MVKTINNFVLLVVICLMGKSCATSNNQNAIEKYCGIEMTIEEVNEISTWSLRYPSPYDIKNGLEIYSEINDSIRNNMPDTAVFELFLIKLTNDEVGIDAYVPNKKEFIEDIACIFVQSKFSSIIPNSRKIRIFTYTNSDGSGEKV